jgi:RHS repeat-associated protein
MKRRAALLAMAWLGCGAAQAQEPVEYYHLDALGSVRVVSDQAGTLLERHDYLPFGEECTAGPCAPNPGAGAGQSRKYTAKERDSETGLDYFGARYHGGRIARFTTVDPLHVQAARLDPQQWNRYAYARNNPLRFVDPDGREVVIIIRRDIYTANSVTGTVAVESDLVSTTWSGYTLENSKAGDNHDKLPIPEGTYEGFVRDDRTPNRVELVGVGGYENIQIHTGNQPSDAKGCFLAGTSRATDWVSSSGTAMEKINEIITADGSGKITVAVVGSPTAPPAAATGSAPQPATPGPPPQ